MGMVTGMAVASVLSAASSKTTEHVETIHFGWTGGQLTMLNQTFTPIRRSRSIASGSISSGSPLTVISESPSFQGGSEHLLYLQSCHTGAESNPRLRRLRRSLNLAI